MDAVSRALAKSRSVVSEAHRQALELKGNGLLRELSPSGGMGSLTSDQTTTRSQTNYRRFHGWLYAAVDALGREGAAQPSRVAQTASKSQQKAPMVMQKAFSRAHQNGYKEMSREIEMLNDHGLNNVLANPNPIQGSWQFAYSFITNLALTGWGFIVSGTNDQGRDEFYSLPTSWVKPLHREGPFSHFKISNPNKPSVEGEIFDRNSVAFAHLPDPSDPLSALAPATAVSAAIRIDDHIQTSQERFFHNGIFPSLVATVGKQPHPEVAAGIRPRLSGTQRRQIYAAIRRTLGDVHNFGAPVILDGLIESVTRLSMNHTEMGWDKSEDKIRTRILSAYGVHPYILGEPVNLGGYAQVAKIEERFCKRVNCFLSLLGCTMTNFVNQDQDDPRLLVFWEPTEPHDPDLLWRNLWSARRHGDITRDEVRSRLGYAPLEADQEDQQRSALLDTVGGINATVQALIAQGRGEVDSEQLAQTFALFFEIPVERARRIVERRDNSPAVDQVLGELCHAVEALKMTPEVAVAETRKLLESQ